MMDDIFVELLRFPLRYDYVTYSLPVVWTVPSWKCL